MTSFQLDVKNLGHLGSWISYYLAGIFFKNYFFLRKCGGYFWKVPTFFWKPYLGKIHKFTVTLPPFLAPVLFLCFLSQEELTGFGGSSLSKRIQKLLTFANFLNIYDHVNTSWGPCKGPIKPKALKLTPSSFKLPSLLLSSFLSSFFFPFFLFLRVFFDEDHF